MKASIFLRLLKMKAFEYKLRSFLTIIVALAAVFALNCNEAEAAWKFVV